MHHPEEFRRDLEPKVRGVAWHGWDHARKRWEKPLPERVAPGRAIGWLRVSDTVPVGNRRLVNSVPSSEDMALFRGGDRVRMSLNGPDGPDFIEAVILGLSAKGLSVAVPQATRVRKLQRFEHFAKWPEIGKVTVDTAERFQGQVREAMIVSFVVSDDAFMDRIPGFLTYPQRLNVAITRARTKVILIHTKRCLNWLEQNAAHDEHAAVARSLFEAAH